MTDLATRLCDHIEGMDYICKCWSCGGDGEYLQTYTAGCGGGYFSMKGTCGYCNGTGILTKDRKPVPTSVINQIEMRKAPYVG